MTIFHRLLTFILELLFNVAINSSKSYTQPNIMHSRRTAKSSAKLFKNASNTPKIKLPDAVAKIDDIITPTVQTIAAVFLREKSNF